MGKLKLLAADSAEDFCCALAEKLGSRYHIKTCHDGIRAQELLRLFAPDILVLDMMLPGIDGISLLQRTSELGLRPTVIATTGYCSGYIVQAAERFQVTYLMRKPCSPEICAERIEDIARQMMPSASPQADPRTTISNLLLQLGFSAKLKGYGYLREGILLFSKDMEQPVTKELYPSIGKLFSSSGERVERAIRSAIQSAWDGGSNELWQLFFSQADGSIRCPSNGEFIARLTDHLLLEKELPHTDNASGEAY